MDDPQDIIHLSKEAQQIPLERRKKDLEAAPQQLLRLGFQVVLHLIAQCASHYFSFLPLNIKFMA
jgi:hypothetical protein